MLIQKQSTAIRTLATAHLAQTMTLLGLTSDELKQKIERELATNPALELIEERRCPNCQHRLPPQGACPVCSQPRSINTDEPVVFLSPREDFYQHTSNQRSQNNNEFPLEYNPPEIANLPHYVLKQIAPEISAEERPLAAYILNQLDSDGLLAVSLQEIAIYHHLSSDKVRQTLNKIQRADPIGVGSPTTKDALLVQLEILKEQNIHPDSLIQNAKKAIEDCQRLLSRHNYAELGKVLNITLEQACELARFISDNLNPFPGRTHWGDIRSAPLAPDVYHNPDIIISFLNNDENSPLVIEVIMPLAGFLRINPLFQKALEDAPTEKEKKWKSDLEQANLLVKCIQQRNHTIVRLSKYLAQYQRDFIIRGDAHLQPMTRAEVAEKLDVHESTISRAVSKKTAQLPSGRIIPLSKFFDRSLPVRTVIKEIINRENEPLSDTQIAKLLIPKGYKVARRTVAKYRSMEGILPSNLR